MSKFVSIDGEKQIIEQSPNETTTITPLIPVDGIYSSNRNGIADEGSLRALLITRNPKICNNRPIILGTRISVSNIVELHEILSWDIRKIREEYPFLNDQQIIAALEYYEQHTQEIDAYLKEEKEISGE